jgi:hypothetical protein
VDYKKNAPVSRNVTVQQPAQSIGDLIGTYAADPQHYMYDHSRLPGGVSNAPLHPDQVQAYVERQPGYIDPERARINALIEALGRR